MSFDITALWNALSPLLQQIPANKSRRLTVAFSGGLDSTVLLYSLYQLQTQHNFQLFAIHINHQLQAEADDWELFARDFCEQRNICYQEQKVSVSRSGKGLEAAARDARYQAFSDLLDNEDVLLTAHHLDDQIETILLRLFRGTGIDGVKGMAPMAVVNGVHIVRPLLSFDRRSLESYAEREQLTWINDPSNTSNCFDRNYLRQRVLPVVEQRWPAYRYTIQRFSSNVIEAENVLYKYISQDYMSIFNEVDKTITISALVRYSIAHQKLLIRHWIKMLETSPPSQRQLQQILNVIAAAEDANPVVQWSNVQVRRYRNKLYLLANEKIQRSPCYQWNLNEALYIPGVGCLSARTVKGSGLKEKLFSGEVTVKFRQGGERCRPNRRSHSHSLKKILQEYSIPPWERDKLPLVYIDDQIVAVAGKFYCEPYVADENEQGLVIDLLKKE